MSEGRYFDVLVDDEPVTWEALMARRPPYMANPTVQFDVARMLSEESARELIAWLRRARIEYELRSAS